MSQRTSIKSSWLNYLEKGCHARVEDGDVVRSVRRVVQEQEDRSNPARPRKRPPRFSSSFSRSQASQSLFSRIHSLWYRRSSLLSRERHHLKHRFDIVTNSALARSSYPSSLGYFSVQCFRSIRVRSCGVLERERGEECRKRQTYKRRGGE